MDIERILKEMTLEDKIALCSGASFWETKRFERYGIPALFMCDGPHGLRKQENAADMLGVNNSRPATCFPSDRPQLCCLAGRLEDSSRTIYCQHRRPDRTRYKARRNAACSGMAARQLVSKLHR